ncbi:platelet binding protein GspB-like isoform X3 [Branchiostoma lanceolatum]|uniref:platelet binding protein GspB-like isoform X3 n=1 Tax=Branchiostoma lanceolatum TaxID=7740 RepID=UPI003457395D
MQKDVMGASCTCVLASDWERNTMATQAESRIPTTVRRRSFLPQRKSLPVQGVAEPAPKVVQSKESSAIKVTEEKKPTGIPSPSSSRPKRGLKPPAISVKLPTAQVTNQAEIPKKSVLSGAEVGVNSAQIEKGSDSEQVSKPTKKAKVDRRRSGIPSLNFGKKNPASSGSKPKTVEEKAGTKVVAAEETVLPQSTKNFTLGDRVTVGGVKCGVLSYVGTVHFSQGEWCGIELDEPIGNHDGTVQDMRYFECSDKHGIFAAASKVELEGACGTTTKQDNAKPNVYGKPPKPPSKLALPKYGRSSLQHPKQTIYGAGPIATVFPTSHSLNSADTNTSEAKEKTGRVGKGKTSLFQATRVSPIQERNVSPAWSNAETDINKGEPDDVNKKINTTVTLDSTFISVSNNPGDSVEKLDKTGKNTSAMADVQDTEIEASNRVDVVDVEPPTTTAAAQDETLDPEGAEADINVADVDTMDIQLDTEERLHESLGSPESEMAPSAPMGGEIIPDGLQEDLPAEDDDVQDVHHHHVTDGQQHQLDVTDGQQLDSDMDGDRQNISYVVAEEKQHSADQSELTVSAGGTSGSTPESQDSKSIDSLEVEQVDSTAIQTAGIVEMEAVAIPIDGVTPDELQTQQTGVPLPSSSPSHDGTFTKDANTTYTAKEIPSQTLLPSRASSEYGTSSSGQDNSPDSLEEQDQGSGNKDNATFVLDTATESMTMEVEDSLSHIKDDQSAIGAHEPVEAAGYISPFPDVILQVVSASEIGPVTDRTFTQAVDDVSYDPAHSILRLDELSMLPEISSENFLQEDAVVSNVDTIAAMDGVPNPQAVEGVNKDSNVNMPWMQTLGSAETETKQPTGESERCDVEPSAITIQVTEPLEDGEDSTESSSDRAQVERLPESERESPTSNDLSSGNTISTDLDSGVGQVDKPLTRESPTSDELSLEEEAAPKVVETAGDSQGKDVVEDSSQVEEEVAASMPAAASKEESISSQDISTTEVKEDANVTKDMVSSLDVEKSVDLSVEEEIDPPDAPQTVKDESPKPAVNVDKLSVDEVEPDPSAEVVVIDDAMEIQAAASTDAVADEVVGIEPQALEMEMLPDEKVEEKEDKFAAGGTVTYEEEPPHKVARVTDQTFEVDDVAEMDVPVQGAENATAKSTFVTEDTVEGAIETEAGVVALELEKLDETFDPSALVTSTPFQHKEFSFSRIDPESPSFATDLVHPLEGEDSLIIADVVRTLEPDIIDHAADNQHISGEVVTKTLDLERKDVKKKPATRAQSDAKSSISQGSLAKKARTASLTSAKQKAPARASVTVSKAAEARKTTAKVSTQFVSKLAVPRTSSKNQANAVAQQSKGTTTMAGSRFKSDSSDPSEKVKSQPPSNAFKTPMGPSSKVGLVRPTPRASPSPQDKRTAADKAKEQPSSSSSTSSPAQRRRLSSTVSDRSDTAARSTRTPGTRSATTTPQARRASTAKESSRSTSGTSSATSSPAVRKRLSSSGELQRKNVENSQSRASSRSSSVSGSPVPKRMSSSRSHINGHAAAKEYSSLQRSSTPTSTPRSDRSGTSTPTSTRSRSNSTSAVRSSPRPGSAASVGSVSSPRGQLKGVAARIDTGLKKRDSSTSLTSTKSDGGKDEGTVSAKEKSARQILYGRLKLKKHSMRKNLLKLICGSNKDEKSGPRTNTNKAETKARPVPTPSTSSRVSSSQKKVPPPSSSTTQKKAPLTNKPSNRKHAEIQHSDRNGHSKRRVSTSSTHSSTSDLSVTSNTSSRLSSSHEEARAQQRAKADALSKPSARSTKVPPAAGRLQGRYLPTPGSRHSPMPGTSGVKRGGESKTSATVSPSPKRVLPVPPSPATRAHHEGRANETRGSRIKGPVSPPPTKASQPDLVASNSVTPSKSSKEIARLEALCEARTKELNITKMQLKEGMTGFDAMAVLVKYLTEEMDAFSHPTLLTQIQRLEEELHHARSERDAQKLDLERLQNDIHNAIASHKDHINKLKDDHAAELKLQEDEFQIVRQAEMGKLATQHRMEVEILADGHKHQLLEIREAHQAATRELEQKHAEEIRNLGALQAQEIEELKRQHQEQISSLTTNFEKTRLSLEDQIETLNFQYQRQKDKAQMFEEALNKDTDMRVQAAITPYKHLPAEVDSLKAVLDIKSQEVHDLRKRNMELDKQVSEIPDLKDKIKMLERKTEDVEAMLSIKSEFHRQMSTEHAQLRQQYERQEYASKRLSMENEELQWKLRNSGSSSPIDAASPIIMGSPARVPRTAITPTLERRRSPTEKRKSLSRSQSTSSDTGIFYTISDEKPSS